MRGALLAATMGSLLLEPAVAAEPVAVAEPVVVAQCRGSSRQHLHSSEPLRCPC
eukprot:COSAG01_NODE_40890_length_458_cov_1.153203_1_plen_53_part_01